MRREFLGGFLILLALTVAVVAAAAMVGAARVPIADVFSDEATRTVLIKLRFPRVLLAAAVGGTLAICGLTFQTLLRNPLADPFILGVSGGAACAAAIATALRLTSVPGLLPIVAFAGACLATGGVFLIARRQRHVDPARLILAGLVLNALFTSLILLSLSIARGGDLTAALRWMMGSLSGATWSDVLLLWIVFALSLLVLTFFGNDLRMLAFGEEDARSRGVDVERVKLVAYLTASIATGAAVAVSGIIGFVGLMVPHAIRLIWRSDFRLLLPLSALGGCALLAAADAGSRVAMAPQELPIGAITALLGVPFFLVIMRRLD